MTPAEKCQSNECEIRNTCTGHAWCTGERKRAPRPPGELVDAIQGVHPGTGRLLAAKPIKLRKTRGGQGNEVIRIPPHEDEATMDQAAFSIINTLTAETTTEKELLTLSYSVVRGLLRCIDDKGFSTSDQQLALRLARLFLAKEEKNA